MPTEYLREILLAVGVLFCVGYAWLSVNEKAPNERSRIYLSVAMVERGDVVVDKEIDRFGHNWDLSKKDGHFYCNKPPGSSLLGAVPYAVARMVTDKSDWSIAGLFQLMRFGLMLPLALLGFVAIRRWMSLLGVSDPVVDIASVGWMMGSSAFHYAGAFFSHHIIAVFFVTAMWLLEKTRQSLRGRSEGIGRPIGVRHIVWMALAGLLLGMNGLTEYQAGIPAVLVTLWILGVTELRRLKLLIPFALAAALCLGGLFLYNDIAFGGPLEFSYFHHISGGDGVAISHPRWDYFSGVMFSLHRGLLTNAPWFLLLFPGVVYLAGRRHQRGTALLLAGVVLFRILFLASYKWWSGDWGFGPRHMVPIMGVTTVLSAVAIDRWFHTIAGEIISKGLVVCGIAYNQIQVAFLGELPLGAKNPLMDVALPFYRADLPSPNLLTAHTGWTGVESLIPLAVVAAALGGFVLVRGVGRTPGFGRRVAIVLVSLLPTVGFGGAVWQIGPSWKQKGRQKFKRAMQHRFDADVRWHKKDDEQAKGKKGK